MNDLTGFKRDLLRGIATLDETKGLRLLRWLEEEAGYHSVNHGRLYPNLNDLADMGLIHKGSLDERTNLYSLTRRGEREVVEQAEAWNSAVAHIPGSLSADGGNGESGLDALFPDDEEET